MKHFIFIILSFLILGCTNSNSTAKVSGADKYIETITGFTCEKAIVTDNGFLVIAIDAIQETDYNSLVSQFLDEAPNEGVSGLKGIYIVDIRTAGLETAGLPETKLGKPTNNLKGFTHLQKNDKDFLNHPIIISNINTTFVIREAYCSPIQRLFFYKYFTQTQPA